MELSSFFAGVNVSLFIDAYNTSRRLW